MATSNGTNDLNDQEVLSILAAQHTDSLLETSEAHGDGSDSSATTSVSKKSRRVVNVFFVGLVIVAVSASWKGATRDTPSSKTKSSASRFDLNGRSSNFAHTRARATSKIDPPPNEGGEETTPSEIKLPFPVIDDDDAIPGQQSGAVPASDALDCRDAVIDYVINATDAKDECDGLKKAFDKTCNSDSAQEIVEGKHSESVGSGRHRRLFESEPQGGWKHRTLRASRSFHEAIKRYVFPHRRRDLFFPEEEVMGESWEEAKSLVLETIELEKEEESYRRRLLESSEFIRRRGLEEADGASNSTKVNPSKTEANSTDAIVNTTETRDNATAAKEKPTRPTTEKPLQSLSLPTSSQHVSNQMLSETLMLQQEGKLASAVAVAANHSNATMKEAAVDAVTSSKAVADTTAAVSAVLNDPTSVEARTCCASILNVFHENCNFPEGEEVSDKRLIIIFFVIAFCGLVKSLIRHFEIRWLPEAAGCILVGVVGGAILTVVPHYDISFDGNWFLRIMVPPIVFEAAVSIDKKSFNRHLIPIVIYAFGGTLLAAALTAFVVHRGSILLNMAGLCGTIPFVESLTFGALISSIDPIAVLSVLSNMGMSDTDTIYVVIFGESLLNDGIAIVLFQTLTHFLDESLIIDSEAVMAAAMHFMVVALGSLSVGIASGMACTVYYWLMHGCHQPLVEVIMFFCWAFMPYYLCDGIEWSGIVAVVATGFVMDLFVVGAHPSHSGGTHTKLDSPGPITPMASKRQSRKDRQIFSKDGHLSALARTHVGFVTEILSTMMETAIFAYLGLFLFSYRYHWNVWHAVLAIFACCASRGIMIPSMSLVANWITALQQKSRSGCRPQRLCSFQQGAAKNPAGVIIDARMQLVLWFAGLRGAMSFALVEHIPLYDPVTGLGSRLKPELKAMTSASIIFTVFVLGGYTFYIMDRVGLAPSKESKAAEMSSLLETRSSSSQERTDSFEIEEVPRAQEAKFRQRHSPSFKIETD